MVILKYNEFYKPDIISSNKLIELNNNEKLFAYMSGSGNNIFELSLNIPFKNSGSSKSNNIFNNTKEGVRPSFSEDDNHKFITPGIHPSNEYIQ